MAHPLGAQLEDGEIITIDRRLTIEASMVPALLDCGDLITCKLSQVVLSGTQTGESLPSRSGKMR